jgi:hypothetical protein
MAQITVVIFTHVLEVIVSVTEASRSTAETTNYLPRLLVVVDIRVTLFFVLKKYLMASTAATSSTI